MRQSGVLLHPTSLPGPGGIGTLGEAAHAFVDFLASAGQTLWQTLPLGPTGYGNSPYQCTSAFAGNPLMIDLEDLVTRGYLDPSALKALPRLPADAVDFEAVIQYKRPLLSRAHTGFVSTASTETRAAFDAFCAREAEWLEDFVLFTALCQENDDRLWLEWPRALVERHPEALAGARQRLAGRLQELRFEQFIFFEQWAALKRYANDKGISLVGDIPIFVALNSSDVWGNPELFLLDAQNRPTFVAGVPPDYFSATGQLWGNPLYRWDVLAEQDYAWWIRRFQTALQTADLVRVDHFRGFESYWAVPADSETAINGTWEPGPGRALFDRLREVLGVIPIIAEDLGIITPEVEALRDAFELPGMKILHFAFGGKAENAYLPHNHIARCVIYPGTHDNDTTVGWYRSASPEVAHHARTYLGTSGDDIAWDLIRASLASVAERAIFTAQDLLSLGAQARLNTPGVESGNWSWRLLPTQLSDTTAQRLHKMTAMYGRA